MSKGSIVENEKGFLIGRLEGLSLCDGCGTKAASIYYVAVLDMWFCEECFKDWYDFAEYYPQDRQSEIYNFTKNSKLFKRNDTTRIK